MLSQPSLQSIFLQHVGFIQVDKQHENFVMAFFGTSQRININLCVRLYFLEQSPSEDSYSCTVRIVDIGSRTIAPNAKTNPNSNLILIRGGRMGGYFPRGNCPDTVDITVDSVLLSLLDFSAFINILSFNLKCVYRCM